MAARHVMTLSLPRRVENEILDSLPSNDPQSQRSRQDLRRIHRAMATLPIRHITVSAPTDNVLMG